MNIIFLFYFTLVISLGCFSWYRWAIVMEIVGISHLVFFYFNNNSLDLSLSFTIFLPFVIYSLSIYFIFYIKLLNQKKLDKIITTCKTQKNQLKQLTTKEQELAARNKTLFQSLRETATVYDYVKNLSSTIDFNEALHVLQRALHLLFHDICAKADAFTEASLVLLNNGTIQEIYKMGFSEDKPKLLFAANNDLFQLITDKVKENVQKNPPYKDGNKLSKNIIWLENEYIAAPLIVGKELTGILVLPEIAKTVLGKIEFIANQFGQEIKKTQLYGKIKELSIIDSLTGLNLRRHFLKLLSQEIQRCSRQNLPLSILMVDIDWFKQYNDEYGHLTGDLILKTVGTLLRDNCRENDVICRYGGDEFLLALPQTALKEALAVAERLRKEIYNYHFEVSEEKFQISISIGIATCDADKLIKENLSTQLIDFADLALYKAKNQGRNRVQIYE